MKIEIEKSEYDSLVAKAKEHDELIELIEKEQEDENADLCSIGEIVLNHLDMWL